MADEKDFEVPATFKGLSRADLIRGRARLLNNPEFQKAAAAGEQEARDAIRDLSQAMVDSGVTTLSPEEMKVTGFE